MASEVDIVNLALAHLGDEANVAAIDPPDGSVQADHGKRFYPIARDAMLDAHNWHFALRRVSLASVTTTELPDNWAYAYAYPNAHRVVAVYLPFAVGSSTSGAIFESPINTALDPQDFTIESLQDGSRIIFTNVENATALYLAKVTDTTKFSPLFTVALSRLLASFIAGPLIKGKAGVDVAKEQLGIFSKVEFPMAVGADSKAHKTSSYDNFTPAALRVRQ